MRKLINIFVLVAALMFVFNSCTNDLDTLPLNDYDATSETAYADQDSYLSGLAYIYGYWALVSQNDFGSSDISVDDAGQSELCRMYMVLNEMSTDALKCTWGDTYVNSIQYNQWTSTEVSATISVYTRCMKGITLCNEYLLQTTDAKLSGRGQSALEDDIHTYRAEARFNRALYYYTLMDLFGNPPFATPENIGGANPSQISRADLFDWLETELTDLTSDDSALKNYGEVKFPRVSKGAAHALLARMYLNAEVYTGTPRWADAKTQAKEAIDAGYKLHDNYAELFEQDNTTNGAVDDEFIFGVSYDKDKTETYGGTTTLMNASLSSDANSGIGSELGVDLISTDNWNGYHVADDYVSRFNLQDVVWGASSGFGYNRENSDKRAFFYNIGNTEEFDNTTTASGWYCWKFNALKSDGTVVSSSEVNGTFSSSDYPLCRLAEMYLIYAEAEVREDGTVDATGLSYIKALRDRAGVSTPAASDITLDWLLDERARELMWEGHRRTDLIRYGYFTSINFPWTLKGGVMNGKVNLPTYKTIYPILTSDINANSDNLVQNPGY